MTLVFSSLQSFHCPSSIQVFLQECFVHVTSLPNKTNNYPLITASYLTSILFSTKLPPFQQTLFSIAFLHKLSPLARSDSLSFAPLRLILDLPILKYTRATWKVHGLYFSVINLRGRDVSHSARGEPAIVCIPTWPHGSLLVTAEAKTLCV